MTEGMPSRVALAGAGSRERRLAARERSAAAELGAAPFVVTAMGTRAVPR